MLLERPLDQILASNMPPGRPGPEGDAVEADSGAESDSGHGTENEEEGGEASPS